MQFRILNDSVMPKHYSFSFFVFFFSTNLTRATDNDISTVSLHDFCLIIHFLEHILLQTITWFFVKRKISFDIYCNRSKHSSQEHRRDQSLLLATSAKNNNNNKLIRYRAKDPYNTTVQRFCHRHVESLKVSTTTSPFALQLRIPIYTKTTHHGSIHFNDFTKSMSLKKEQEASQIQTSGCDLVSEALVQAGCSRLLAHWPYHTHTHRV